MKHKNHLSIPYAFPDSYAEDATYTVTYSKNVEDFLPANKDGSINNTAIIENKGNGTSYEGSNNVGSIMYTTYALDKKYTDIDTETHTYSWESKIGIPNDVSQLPTT